MLRLCLTASIFFRYIRPSLASEDEFRLLRDLRENYDNVERPVLNHTQAVDVKLRVILQQILNVDAKDQTLTLVLWLQFSWSDYNMIWSPEEYGGISQIQLPAGTLWRPDVLLFNSADNFDSRFDVNFIVKHDGTVQQVPPAIVKCSCNIDITWFPFDEQMCILNFGSWTYTGNLLNLTIDDPSNETGVHMMDVSYYVPNGEWDLVATPAKRVTNPFLADFYVELHFYLHMRRKVVYYGINWLIPALLFLLTSVLGFSLPSQCGEKITLRSSTAYFLWEVHFLETTNLLSMTSFLGIVSSYTPPSTSVPVIAVFFSFSMIILGLSVIFTVLVINFHFRSPKTHKMSPW
ncbi:EAT-2 protein, partial [Aphelenchoides avenae]